jgi:hypothetical protein
MRKLVAQQWVTVEFSGRLGVRYASELRWNVAYMSATGAELMPVRRIASMKSIGSIGERAVLFCALCLGARRAHSFGTTY